MENVGYAVLQVIPSMRGAAGALESELTGTLGTAGRAAGRAAGAGIASGIEASRAQVAAASAKLSTARDKEADAAGKVRVAELKLQELRDSGRATASQLATAEERLQTAQRNALRTTEAATRATDDLEEANRRAANATDETEQSTGRFRSGLGNLGGSIDDNAKKLGGMAIAAAGVGTAMELAMSSMENEVSTDRLAASLGVDGEQAAELASTTASIYSQAFGESMGEVSEAVGIVQSSFHTLGFEGEASLDTVTKNALNFADTFGTDVSSAVQTASQLLNNGLAADSTEAFDLMTQSFQRVPAAMRDELPEIIQEYGTNFRSLGFTGEESFNLLVSAAEQGKFALDKTGDSLKEFTIRGSDMSEASSNAYKAIGLDAQEMSNAVAAGGEGAQNALQRTAQGLLEIEDPATRANTAIALFGTPLEDLSIDQIPAFLSGLAGAEPAMAGFEGATERMGTTLSDNGATKLEEFKRSLQTGLIESLQNSVVWMQENETVTKVLAITVGTLGAAYITYKAVTMGIQAATTIATAAQWLWNAALTANPIGIIVVAIGALVGSLVYFFTQTEVGREIVTATWDAILQGWNWMYEKVSGGITALGDYFGYIGDKAGEAKDWVVGKFGELVGFVTGLPGRISDAASGMWDGLSNGFKGVLNWIIGKWNNFSLGFNLPSIVGGGRVSIDTPDIPYFRDGGMLNGPGGPRSDSMLIRASTGEFINKASSVTPQTLPILEAINDGWVPSADFLHSMVGGFGSLIGRGDYTGNVLGQEEDSPLVDAILRGRELAGFADGGMVTKDALRDFARGVDGKPYDWGGVNWGDCSGAVSALANFATGRDPFGSRFATGNEADELAARGFVQGKGVRGEDLLIGFLNGGPGGGHTAATLPTGENFEMGGSYGGGKFGGTVGGDDSQFTDFWHLPGSSFTGGNPAPAELPVGDADVDVPASPSTGGGSPAPSSSSSSSPGAGASFSPGGGVDSSYQSSIDTSATPGSIAGDFVKANVDQAFSDLGIPTQAGGLLKGLLEGAKIVEEHIHYHVADMDEAMSKDRARRREDALAFQATR
ncbi:phage tail tape measure protein [Rhodococcoides fascians]|uniref:phage tail tape measure protein n=1 Tax=Rhodococcoides fascians TaxID=1828 RepID=UPI002783C599|nr:phage tail tape measure protein [Rhodococcus fascians]MDQ0283757.1 phage-related minor tail protein [Rhodococcus fascians]